MDAKKRAELLAEAQRKIQADAPVIPLLNPNIMLAVRKEVQGAVVWPMSYNLETITLQKE
jgi:ABC-type transport system substrate-binding protein